MLHGLNALRAAEGEHKQELVCKLVDQLVLEQLVTVDHVIR